jgi:enoyl-ACP reductase-like protein
MDFGKKGVRVNSVCPSVTRTGMTADMMDDKELLSKFAERIPLGRVCEPREIAAVIAFLAWRGRQLHDRRERGRGRRRLRVERPAAAVGRANLLVPARHHIRARTRRRAIAAGTDGRLAQPRPTGSSPPARTSKAVLGADLNLLGAVTLVCQPRGFGHCRGWRHCEDKCCRGRTVILRTMPASPW